MEALYSYCEERELCINTPVSARLKTLVTVTGLVADILNCFSGKLSYNSIALILTLIFIVIAYQRFFGAEKEVKIELTVNGNDVKMNQ